MTQKNSTLSLLLTVLAATPASAAPIAADLVTGFPFSAGEAANGNIDRRSGSATALPAASDDLFADGFEIGDSDAWSQSLP